MIGRLGVVAIIVVAFSVFLAIADSFTDPAVAPRPKAPADPVRGPRPEFRALDASYAPVNAYLRRVLNDPRSLQMQGCTDPVAAPEAWVVRCEFRAPNRFGALVLQNYAFTIRHGEVIAANPL